jgi:hypothetical protein
LVNGIDICAPLNEQKDLVNTTTSYGTQQLFVNAVAVAGAARNVAIAVAVVITATMVVAVCVAGAARNVAIAVATISCPYICRRQSQRSSRGFVDHHRPNTGMWPPIPSLEMLSLSFAVVHLRAIGRHDVAIAVHWLIIVADLDSIFQCERAGRKPSVSVSAWRSRPVSGCGSVSSRRHSYVTMNRK